MKKKLYKDIHVKCTFHLIIDMFLDYKSRYMDEPKEAHNSFCKYLLSCIHGSRFDSIGCC